MEMGKLYAISDERKINCLQHKKHLQFQSRRLRFTRLSAMYINQEIAENFETCRFTHAPVSLEAVWLNEKLYLHPPKTSHSIYPYPREMRQEILILFGKIGRAHV